MKTTLTDVYKYLKSLENRIKEQDKLIEELSEHSPYPIPPHDSVLLIDEYDKRKNPKNYVFIYEVDVGEPKRTPKGEPKRTPKITVPREAYDTAYSLLSRPTTVSGKSVYSDNEVKEYLMKWMHLSNIHPMYCEKLAVDLVQFIKKHNYDLNAWDTSTNR